MRASQTPAKMLLGTSSQGSLPRSPRWTSDEATRTGMTRTISRFSRRGLRGVPPKRRRKSSARSSVRKLEAGCDRLRLCHHDARSTLGRDLPDAVACPFQQDNWGAQEPEPFQTGSESSGGGALPSNAFLGIDRPQRRAGHRVAQFFLSVSVDTWRRSSSHP